jgi:hypothetical protein
MPAANQLLEALRRYRLQAIAGGGVLAVVVVIVLVVLLATGGSSAGGDATPAVSPTPDSTPTPATGTPRASPTPRGTPNGTPEPSATAASNGGQPGAPTQPPSNGQPTPVPSRATNTPRPPTATPAGLSISVVSPQNGANVGSTVTVQVAVTGIQIALGPGGALIPGAGHWHHAVDSVLQATPHGTLSAQVGPLTPGTHVITVTLNLNDADLTVVAINQVTVNVK